jgi:small subunit ribosomal protein S2
MVDYAIPANDDASTSIAYIIELMVNAVKEGLSERKIDKEAADEQEARDGSSESDEHGDSESGEEDEEEKGGAKKRRRVVARK